MSFRIALIFLAIFPFRSFAQDLNNSIPFNKETGIGINFNTNGGLVGGFLFKKSIYLRKNIYKYFYIEAVNVKHPKEFRYPSSTGNTFIYYKSNYLFSFRPMYGREFLLFRKSEEEGVRVSAILAGGITLGLVKPYAIQFDYTNYPNGIQTGTPTDVRNEQFDPDKYPDQLTYFNRILGTGGLFTAINKSKIVPGICAKAGLSFDIGPSTTGIEVGGLIEVFPHKIPILYSASNYSTFTSIYINIYYANRN